jgi:hypothetical protein
VRLRISHCSHTLSDDGGRCQESVIANPLTTLTSVPEIIISIHVSLVPAVVGNKSPVVLEELLHDLVILVGNTASSFELSPNVQSSVQEDIGR